MVMMVFLVLVSQQTSFLSRPTDSARLSLMGLKVMAEAGAMWGVRLNKDLFVLQSQNERIPLSLLAPRNEGYKVIYKELIWI